MQVVSCEQLPQASISKEAVFGDEKGLELYTNSLYNMLPAANDVHRADCMTDYTSRRDAPAFLREGSYTPTSSVMLRMNQLIL